jgi:succinoglycan biosynthesis transport protein ExoP
MNDMNPRYAAQGTAPAPGANDSVTLFPLLGHYLTVFQRRRWLIFGSIVTAIVAAAIVILLMTRMYTARATIEIQRESNNIVRVQGVEPETGLADMEFYQTQYGLLQSHALAASVATELRLFDDASFFQMFEMREAETWFENGRVRPGVSSRQQRIRKVADQLLRNLSVTPVRLSRLVHVNFTSPDAAFSARVANAWGEHFIRMALERRFAATSYAREFLEQRLDQLRTRLDESERVLVGYAEREGLVSLPASPAFGMGERPLIVDDLAALNRELTTATADRVQAESRLGVPGDRVGEALQNQAISGLRQRRAETAAELARLQVQFEPEYPPLVALRQQIEQLDRSIEREENRVRDTLRANFAASTEREANLTRRVEQLKAGLLDQRRRSIQYNIYQREVDTNRQLYDALLQRYKEIGVAGGVGINNISIVDVAQVPERPSSPRILIYLVLAMGLGGITGFVLALVIEQMDDAISDPSQVQKLFELPLLGTVPRSPGDEDPYALVDDRKSDLAEAYLAVQTSLAFTTDHGAPATLTVTSTRPGEGKSTTAYAVARSLARTGRRVLLIDGDMRAPSFHHIMGLSNDRGFSNFLAGDDNLSDMIHSPPGDVAVMPAGPQPPSAAELLSGGRFADLLRRLNDRFDHIVIDSPPVMGLADAPLLASRTEGTVFVIEANETKLGQARMAIARLLAANAHMLGAVVTKFEARRTAYGYEYGYGYGRSAEQTT